MSIRPAPRPPRSPVARGEDPGFTLVELVIAVAILGTVMAVLAATMLVALTGNRQTGERLGESNDVAFAVSYFADDAEGALEISSGRGAHCGGGTAAVEFRGQSFTDLNQVTDTVVSYVLQASGSSRELHRRACSGASLRSDVVLARQVSTVTVRCQSAAGSWGACATSSAGARLQLTEDSGFSFTLIGTRRTS